MEIIEPSSKLHWITQLSSCWCPFCGTALSTIWYSRTLPFLCLLECDSCHHLSSKCIKETWFYIHFWFYLSPANAIIKTTTTNDINKWICLKLVFSDFIFRSHFFWCFEETLSEGCALRVWAISSFSPNGRLVQRTTPMRQGEIDGNWIWMFPQILVPQDGWCK